MRCHQFCISCHGLSMHYPECTDPEVYAISTSAEIPLRKSSKRK